MEKVVLRTSELRPTSTESLDLNRVGRLIDMLRRGREMFPIIIVRDEHEIGYIVSGHEESYAACYVNGEVNAFVLKTDLNVSNCRLGRAGRHHTIADLVEDCKRGNEDCIRHGINSLADYGVPQPVRVYRPAT